MKKDVSEEVLQHFRKEEQPFIELALGWIREVDQMYVPKLTYFLDPRQRYIVETLVKKSDLSFACNGAFAQAERQRILIHPSYYHPTEEDFQTVIVGVHYASKFQSIEHPQVLGTLLSLGVDRSRFGDIRVQGERIQFAVAQELADYLLVNCQKIASISVKLHVVENRDEWLEVTENWKEVLQIVSSLRLDTVVAALLSTSRQKAVALIQAEQVRVNWTVQHQPAFEVNESDMISIRKAGRFKIYSIEGRTKKDKLRLLTGKLE